MPCRLCARSRVLCRSHIVPEFLYKSFYDPKGRFFGLSVDPTREPKYFQKGLREQLLCVECEGKFAVYEKYASQFFKKTSSLVTGVELNELDYKPLKLFFLSLLWRFGVTSLEYFEGVKLGRHEKRIRRMLLSEDPGTGMTYPFSLVAVLAEGQRLNDLIMQPSDAEVEPAKAWRLVVAGHVVTYFIKANGFEEMLRHVALRPPGTIFFQVREVADIPFLFDYARRTAEAQRLRGWKPPK